MPLVDCEIDQSFMQQEQKQRLEERGYCANLLIEFVYYLKFVWEHMPLGSIKLPLYDGDR